MMNFSDRAMWLVNSLHFTVSSVQVSMDRNFIATMENSTEVPQKTKSRVAI